MSQDHEDTVDPVAGGQDADPDSGPERHAVPDGTRQAGNSASTSPGGGDMGVAPIAADNRNTNVDRDRDEAARRGVSSPSTTSEDSA